MRLRAGPSSRSTSNRALEAAKSTGSAMQPDGPMEVRRKVIGLKGARRASGTFFGVCCINLVTHGLASIILDNHDFRRSSHPGAREGCLDRAGACFVTRTLAPCAPLSGLKTGRPCWHGLRAITTRAGNSPRRLLSTVPCLSHMSMEAEANAVAVPASRRLCVAPMMDWTDRFDRYFLRRFSKNTWLYTEMVTTGAIIHGDQDRHLKFFPAEHPIALQLGGSDPDDLAKCAAIGEGYGYDEINLNVGCPSERVSSGSFGACLMAEPELVRDCVAAMRSAVKVPVTVKHRIGIDNRESYEELCEFVRTVHEGGCNTFIVHARIAVLKGLSPKENREIPPLKYDWVYKLKRDFPHLEIIINGGITDLAQAREHLEGGKVDGVMIGRSAYHEPFHILGKADELIYGDVHGYSKTRQEVVEEMVPFIEEQLVAGVSLNSITRHMLGLFHGCKGGKAFRRHISDNVHKQGSGVHTFLEAVDKVPEDIRLGTASSDNPKGPRPAHLAPLSRTSDSDSGHQGPDLDASSQSSLEASSGQLLGHGINGRMHGG